MKNFEVLQLSECVQLCGGWGGFRLVTHSGMVVYAAGGIAGWCL